MFAFLKGEVKIKSKDMVVVDVNDIGYEVYMTQGDIEHIQKDEKITIHIYTDIKEGYIGLFGFLSLEAKSVFEKLKKVGGIGSKTALNVLSNMSPSDVCLAIASSDSTLLSKIPGIGSKTASRIILELKDKILKDNNEILTATAIKKNSKTNTVTNEATLALKVLGYTSSTIEQAMQIENVDKLTVEQVIKETLRNINKR